MLETKKLASFYYTAKLGSQVKASAYLEIAQGTVASNIKSLEKDLDTDLFKGRSHLTDSGHELFQCLLQYFPKLEEVEKRILKKQIDYRPQLVIGGTPGLCGDWLDTFVARFLEEEKNIKLVMTTYYLGKDLKKSSEKCDVIISDSFNSHLDRKKLHTFTFGLYASKGYISKYGLPRKPEDLDNHRLIEFASDEENPFLGVDRLLHTGSTKERETSVTTNTSTGEARLVNEGAGIACISPENKNIDLDNVVHIDIGVPDEKVDIYYYYKRNAPQSNPLILKFYDLIQREKKKT